MDTPVSSVAQDIAKLRGCLEELLGALARSGIWTDGIASADVRSLLDALPEVVERIAQETKALAAALTTQEAAERQRAEEAPPERDSRTIVNTIPGLVAILTPAGEVDVVNQEFLEYCGQPLEAMRQWRTNGTVHVEDLPRIGPLFTQAMASGVPHDFEARIRRFDGVYRWCLVRGLPLRNPSGGVTRWYVVFIDIDERKRAEQELRRSEEELRTVIDAIRQLVVVLAPDGGTVYANKRTLEAIGLTLSDSTDEGLLAREGVTSPARVPGEPAWKNQVWSLVAHPDDRDRFQVERQAGLSRGIAFEVEARARFKTGEYRWQLFLYNPLKDESGRILRWYVTLTDIEDRKRTEDRLRNENLVLRDEVDRTSMFEEIVGTSSTLQPVLARVAKVAQSESTVLVTGETGTGKELIARAVHRRSARASHAFVGVNCAAVPRELISSDLFGHEKGAFTGATQRRLGRFELAHGGTIFLDEVGDLPMDTQVLLLRVLQEREFERVGGNSSIRVDVRVIAATNRDLQAAIEEGTFRSDLFYRLNVFPIAMPALRQRVDDIPLLVEYFIDRYARKLGKTFQRVNKRTLNDLRSYPWPGNVRELQNVIERSVIVCDSDEFRVDESWLSAKPATERRLGLAGTLAAQEKAAIEDALRASEGRVFGPAGAAARLGIPRSTLESRIRALNIDKGRFRTRLVKS